MNGLHIHLVGVAMYCALASTSALNTALGIIEIKNSYIWSHPVHSFSSAQS